MKSNLNISVNDLSDLSKEGRLLINEKNIFKGSLELKNKSEIGFINCNFHNTRDYCVSENEAIFYKDVKLFGHEGSFFVMSFLMEGIANRSHRNLDINETGSKNNAGYFNANDYLYTRHKSNVYSKSFEIIIKDDTLEELANKYPELLSTVYRNSLKENSFLVNQHYHKTTVEMLQIISQIKNAGLMGNSSHIYIEAKIQELLFIQMQQGLDSQIETNQNQCRSIDDLDKIHEARRLLLADLNQTPTIPELSKCVGINECKLKYGFKKIHNQTIFECLFDYKMDFARKLLLNTNKAVLDIAFDCGYNDASYFAVAFRKKYGVAPKRFRDKA